MSKLGTQYYVAGRFLTVAQTVPVAGNLLHHAVEMYLKGALTQNHSLDEITKYRHNLNRLWRRFKDQFRDPALSEFDHIVSNLHRFERIRYPDTMIIEGATIQFALYKGQIVGHPAHPTDSVPAYELTLEEIDELVFLIISKANVNPTFYMGALHEHASKFLRIHNKYLPDLAS